VQVWFYCPYRQERRRCMRILWGDLQRSRAHSGHGVPHEQGKEKEGHAGICYEPRLKKNINRRSFIKLFGRQISVFLLRKLSQCDSQCPFSPNARSRIGRRLSIQIFRICMTPMNRTKFSGSGNIKHHSHSMSDRRGPAIFFLSSGSLIYHRRGLPLLITPCTASFGLAEKGLR